MLSCSSSESRPHQAELDISFRRFCWARMNSAEEDLLRRVKEQAEVLARRQEETRGLILALRSISKGWATSGIERAAALGAVDLRLCATHWREQ
jgi:hypothetical protein